MEREVAALREQPHQHDLAEDRQTDHGGGQRELRAPRPPRDRQAGEHEDQEQERERARRERQDDEHGEPASLALLERPQCEQRKCDAEREGKSG